MDLTHTLFCLYIIIISGSILYGIIIVRTRVFFIRISVEFCPVHCCSVNSDHNSNLHCHNNHYIQYNNNNRKPHTVYMFVYDIVTYIIVLFRIA